MTGPTLPLWDEAQARLRELLKKGGLNEDIHANGLFLAIKAMVMMSQHHEALCRKEAARHKRGSDAYKACMRLVDDRAALSEILAKSFAWVVHPDKVQEIFDLTLPKH